VALEAGAAAGSDQAGLDRLVGLAIDGIDEVGEPVLDEPLLGAYPLGISIPSDSVAYFLCQDRIIKYSR